MIKIDNRPAFTYVRLLKYVSHHWFAILIAISGLIMHSIAEVAFVDLLGFITDTVGQLTAIPGQDTKPLPLTGITAFFSDRFFGSQPADRAWLIIPTFLIAVSLMRGLGYLIGTYGLAYVANYLVHTLRSEIFNKYLLLPIKFFDQSMSGHLVSVITFNVQQVTEAGTKAVKTMLQQGSLVIGLLTYLFYVNWRLAIFFLAVMPLIALLVGYVSKRFRIISKRIQSAMGDVTHVTQEAVNGYSEVRMYGGADMERQRLLLASHANRRQNLKMSLTEGVSNPLVMLLVSIAFAAVTGLMLNPIILSNMTTGSFITFLVASGMLIKPVRQLSEINSSIQRGIAAAASIFEILDADQEVNKGEYTVDRASGKFVFKNVSFCYPDSDRTVLTRLTFSVDPGQTVAIVGSSGSGKTSLISLIMRFYDYQRGSIHLDDVDINEYTLSNLRHQIALVSQNITLFNDSILNNIAYGALAKSELKEVRNAARVANADEFISELSDGYETIIGDDGVLLSGGQRQRIAIARAVLKDAPILILDEATSSLDTDGERQIQEALELLMENRTTFVIAHRLTTVERADHILVMENGQILEQGTHKELIAQAGRYVDLHRNQFVLME